MMSGDLKRFSSFLCKSELQYTLTIDRKLGKKDNDENKKLALCVLRYFTNVQIKFVKQKINLGKFVTKY